MSGGAYARALLREADAHPARPPEDPAGLSAAADWARSGALLLTGRAEGPPVLPRAPLATCARGAGLALASLTDSPSLVSLDAAARLECALGGSPLWAAPGTRRPRRREGRVQRTAGRRTAGLSDLYRLLNGAKRHESWDFTSDHGRASLEAHLEAVDAVLEAARPPRVRTAYSSSIT